MAMGMGMGAELAFLAALRMFVRSRGHELDESSESELQIPVLPAGSILTEEVFLLAQAKYEK